MGRAIELGIEWVTKFDWLKILIPVIVSMIVFLIFARNINKLINKAVGPQGELKKLMNESLGAFRLDLRAMLADERKIHKTKLIQDAKDIERGQDVENRKRAIAIRSATPPVSQLDDDEDTEQQDKNWGELQAMWEQVWYWSKQQLSQALQHEKRGRVIGKLREANLRSPGDVISMLYRYGWYGDESSNLALEMAGMFNQFKTKRVAVDEGSIRQFRKLYSKWEKIDE
jgi:hypothetical protein